MLNTIFQSKNIFFLLLILFFGLFIIINGMKKMGLTEGMSNGEDTITGVSSSLTKVYNF
jgi:Na+/H+ antiporter NhaD/arsenite permease-like protein